MPREDDRKSKERSQNFKGGDTNPQEDDGNFREDDTHRPEAYRMAKEGDYYTRKLNFYI